MIRLFLFVLATVSLTDFIITARILKTLREWVTKKKLSLGYLLSCRQCVGIYSGLLIYLLMDLELYLFIFIIIGSFTSKLSKKII